MATRWTTEFLNHSFRSIWDQLKSELIELVPDDDIEQSAILEIVRLKRIVTYIDTIVETIDPELMPRSIWSEFHAQVTPCFQQIQNYKLNRGLDHLRAANDYADGMLSCLRPYERLPANVLKALVDSSRTYANEVLKVVESFKTTSNQLQQSINDDKVVVAQDRSITDKHKKRIETFVHELFEGTNDEESLEAKIKKFLATTNSASKEIDELHTALLVGTPDALSLQARMTISTEETERASEKLNTLLADAQSNIRSLTAFYEKIFGKKNELGDAVGGLERELAERFSQLTNFEKNQQLKHAALIGQVETLLPGATSAGLASSYKILKDSFTRPITIFTWVFAASLSVLVLGGVVTVVQDFTLSPLHLKLIDVAEWDVIIRALIYKAPFIAPVVWLAVFSSTRRSQYERLQQEYAHKEAFAASYQSYKTQLEAFQSEGDGLQRELIAKAIDAIAYNASTTLDRNHQEKLPSQQLLENFNLDQIKKLSEFIKDWKK